MLDLRDSVLRILGDGVPAMFKLRPILFIVYIGIGLHKMHEPICSASQWHVFGMPDIVRIQMQYYRGSLGVPEQLLRE